MTFTKTLNILTVDRMLVIVVHVLIYLGNRRFDAKGFNVNVCKLSDFKAQKSAADSAGECIL